MSFEDKPIVLVTGAPGAGKTALIVKFIKEAADAGRPIYQVGIPELKVPYIPIPPDMGDWTELREDPEMPGKQLPYFTFPERSLIVLSEAQRLYRPRPAASKLPDYVAAFETCRHTGVTFILDTQHPDFLDSHVRKLIGQHIHLIDHGILGRKHYEWPYLGSPEQFKTAPIKKPYKLPKSIYGLYKSSSLHIKRNYTFPPALKLLIVLLVLMGLAGTYLYSSLKAKFYPVSEVAALKKPGTPGALDTLTPAQPGAPVPVDPAALLMEFSPRVTGRPETAPAYDTLRQVKNMPQVVGCYKTKTSCACQDQQGLDAGLDALQCQRWIDHPRFDAYREAPRQPLTASADKPAERPARQADVIPPVMPLPASVPDQPAKPNNGI